MKNKYIFTSESVSEGHPDKVCDQVSDVILDLYLSEDNNARVACETLATTNTIIISGEISISKNRESINPSRIENAIRKKIKEIGYEQPGFHWQNVKIENYLHQQSKDIAMGVDEDQNDGLQGAGDQGIMFGFACDETDSLMPAPIKLSHNILKKLSEYRHNNKSFFGPDSKSQVSVIYENNRPVGISSVVLSTQHDENASNDDIREKVIEIIKPALPDLWVPEEENFLINPTGRFVVGGPDGDTGLTGRKIIVDTYGGAAPHGGGAFSGKDQTKVDRSAAYMARYVAKNIVASKLSKKCLIQLSYAIGVSQPISIYIKTDEEADFDHERLSDYLRQNIDFSPHGIKNLLNLDKPIFTQTATYGHFGRKYCPDTGCFSWEKTDIAEEILSIFK
tara:strand:+ start:138 stop:1316 length:1179 start_codon:yes stop_codon:yes gene_type:complete